MENKLQAGVLGLTLFALCGPVLGQPTYGNELRVGVFPAEPLAFYGENQKAEGLFPNLLRKIFKDHTEWSLKFIPITWSDSLRLLEQEEIDLMVSVGWTPERAKIMDFNEQAVVEVWGQIFVREGIQLNRAAQLENQRVGIMMKDLNATHFIQLCDALNLDFIPVQYPTHQAVFEAIEAGEIDAGVAPHQMGLGMASDYQVSGTTIQFSPFNVYFATKEGRHTDILNQIDRHLMAWKEDPDSIYYEELDYWLSGERVWHELAPLWFWYLLGSASFSLLMLVGLNRLLKRRMTRQTRDLRESRERFELAVSAGGIAVWDRDCMRNRLIWDKRMLEIYGLSGEAFDGSFETWKDRLHPDDAEAAIQAVHLAEEDKQPFDTEFRILRPDGEVRHIKAYGRVIRDTKGHAIRMIGTNQDVTEQRQADEQMRFLINIFNQTQDLVLLTDLEGNIIYANPAENEFFSTQTQSLVGQSIHTLGDDPESDATQDLILRETKTKGRWHGRVKNRLPDGRSITLNCRTKLLKDQNDKPYAICGISTDVTRQIDAEEKLRARNEELEHFNHLATGRELRMMELKHEINVLSRLCGRPEPYSMAKDPNGRSRNHNVNSTD